MYKILIIPWYTIVDGDGRATDVYAGCSVVSYDTKEQAEETCSILDNSHLQLNYQRLYK